MGIRGSLCYFYETKTEFLKVDLVFIEKLSNQD